VFPAVNEAEVDEAPDDETLPSPLLRAHVYAAPDGQLATLLPLRQVIDAVKVCWPPVVMLMETGERETWLSVATELVTVITVEAVLVVPLSVALT
jgi:hypothetical protein